MQNLDQKRRPQAHDYAPFYAAYVEEVETDDIVRFLEKQKGQIQAFLKQIPWEQWELSYAEGKWTLAQLMLHLIDAERIFAYRALCIARGDQTPLPEFDQEAYAETSEANSRTPVSLTEEFAAVREATVHLFRNFSPAMWAQRGTAAGSTITPLALAWIIGGHAEHHLRVMRERYWDA